MTKRDELIALGGVGVKVKPLVWRDHRPDSFPEPAWSAQTPFGFYNVEEVSASDSPAYVVRLHAHHFIADKDSLDDAKAAAQADYERRVLSALEAPAAGDGEPVAWQFLCADGVWRNCLPPPEYDLKQNKGRFRQLYTAPPADAGMREAFVRVLASLAAAISILERTPKAKKAVASDKMFDQMLDDYRNALEIGRAAVRAAPGEVVAMREALEDCQTHHDAWRSAITAMFAQGDPDELYWQHELNAFDRTFKALTAPGATTKSDGGQAPGTGSGSGNSESPLDWAVGRWNAEVKNRSLKNIHRSSLDTTWRQVIRHFGGDPDVLVGPDHHSLIEIITTSSTSDPSSTRSEVTVDELAATLCRACGDYWWQSSIHNSDNRRWIERATKMLDQFEIRRK